MVPNGATHYICGKAKSNKLSALSRVKDAKMNSLRHNLTNAHRWMLPSRKINRHERCFRIIYNNSLVLSTKYYY